MKGLKERLFAGFSLKIVPVLICACILFVPFNAFAVNTDLVQDEIYWIDNGNIINYTKDSYFQGFTKYISDEDNKCFYLFSRFTDYRIDTLSNENITLSFTVKNDVNTYMFEVDKDGVTNNSSRNATDSVNVYYNFDEASCKKQGGGIFVALEFKNPTDKILKNTISCEYSCGLNCTYDLFDYIVLDMYEPQATKASQQKTTKASTSKATTQRTDNSQEVKEKTTKFSGTGTYGGNASTGIVTKFYANTVKSAQESSDISDVPDAEGESSVQDFQNDTFNGKSTGLSTQAKVLVAVFAVLLAAGGACVAIGAANSKKADKEKEE